VKIRFADATWDEVVLNPDSGEFETSSMLATISYFFEDDTIKLKVNDQWFEKEDLEQLIVFLQAAKARLK
jgi:hypothetical protein